MDRRALPVPEGRQEAGGYVAPRTPVEEVLAAIWAEVLRVDQVGITDNFFDLGGHSLLAMRLIARMRNHLGVALPLREVFEAAEIRQLARVIENIRWAAETAEQSIANAEREGGVL